MLTVGRFLRKKIIFKNTDLLRNFTNVYRKLKEDDVEEIKIPVPWGHIAGKWWGDRNTTPALAIHGWQDNANSFDRLIPLLNLSSVLAIDLPGHGYSTHLPLGKSYDFEDYLVVLHRIKTHFNWSKMSILGHSLGSALGYAYTSIFPDSVKWLINIECGRALLTVFRADLSFGIANGWDELLKIEKQKKKGFPITYKLSEMVHMSLKGSLGSVTSPESALILLKRGTHLADQSSFPKSKENMSFKTNFQDFIAFEMANIKLFPEEEREIAYRFYQSQLSSLNKVLDETKNFYLNDADDKYYTFIRDPSIKAQVFQSYDEEFLIEASKCIKCPVLGLKARNGFLNGSTRKLYEKTIDILKTASVYHEHHEVEGSHHAHLNDPRRWWGSKQSKPILSIHGWQDNANTFNTLIPLLLPEFSYFVIDLPGHGLSSHYPKGFFYKPHEVVGLIRRIELYFNWNKVSLLGHSYGAVCGFLFSSCYPKDVDFLVAIDTLKPISKNSKEYIENTSKTITKMLSYESQSLATAPLYSKNDLIQRWIKGSNNSLTEKSCEILMERGAEELNGLFRLRRDPTVKLTFSTFTQKEILKMAESITCSVLFVKATGSPYYEKKENVIDVMNILKSKTKHFEYYKLEGTHHLHLNNPEVIAPVINSFIKTSIGLQ